MRSFALCGLSVFLPVFFLNLYLPLIRFLRVILKNLSHVDPVFRSLWEWHSPIIYLAVHCYRVIDEHNMLLESLNSDTIVSRLKTVTWAVPLEFFLLELLKSVVLSAFQSSECLFVYKTTEEQSFIHHTIREDGWEMYVNQNYNESNLIFKAACGNHGAFFLPLNEK